MSNALKILTTLDKHLTKHTALVLYGRAALVLGFSGSPPDAALSLDVDVILTTEQSSELDQDESFWMALEAANGELAPSGLYVTHLFEESQVILRPDWKQHLVPLPVMGCQRLSLSRPHGVDLLLTKMMRGTDPQDMIDAQFIIESEQLTREAIETAVAGARVPDIDDIHAAFLTAVPIVLNMAKL
ncbi:hypothetical protein DES53_107120 [Roseimicrobium gellanilyticum]|uniref:Uncharacterized protein n=1 Tax=Roseimicrobium gellanilyticum TaxID=748857 RepID=A0A366HI55_9BACT|nr:hypothetical protein [Roseimicrobium gellanilyticum]RBP41289.1 hypothetical protein DES53_107120 [Roseimicrobium gellanilyticum]